MTLKEFISKTEELLKGDRFPILKQLWLDGKKLKDIAREEKVSPPAISYRLRQELTEFANRMKVDPSSFLGKHIKANVFAPKHDSLLANMLSFFTAPQRKKGNLFFNFAYREDNVFYTPKGLSEVKELASIIEKELSVANIKKLFEELKDRFSLESIGFVIRRKSKRLPIPIPKTADKSKELEAIYEKLAEIQQTILELQKQIELNAQKVDAILKEIESRQGGKQWL